MIVSVPAAAPCVPPLTGASRNVTFRAAQAAASDRLTAGAMVLISTITEPGVPYFAAVHDLEYAVKLLDAATSDASSEIAAALFEHLAQNWSLLERSTRAQVALVPEGAHPGM